MLYMLVLSLEDWKIILHQKYEISFIFLGFFFLGVVVGVGFWKKNLLQDKEHE